MNQTIAASGHRKPLGSYDQRPLVDLVTPVLKRRKRLPLKEGDRFGRLTVTGFHVVIMKNGDKLTKAVVKCECGTPEKSVFISNLVRGTTLSCGCLASEKTSKRSKIHGMVGTPLYKRWKSMKDRCAGHCEAAKRLYHGRGIKVCRRWYSFKNFLEDMGHPPSPSHQIDRINNDGDYCPENCRWATPLENSNNTRKNRNITFKGRTQSISMWAREKGWVPKVILNRLNRGWSVERTLTTEPLFTRSKRR